MARIILLAVSIIFFYYLYNRIRKILKEHKAQTEEVQNYHFSEILHDVSRPGTGEIYKLEDGGFEMSLAILDQIELRNSLLIDHGYRGGAGSWLGVIYGAVKLSDPALNFQIDMEVENEVLIIRSQQQRTLEGVSRLVYELMLNEQAFIEAIQAAEFDDKIA